MKPFTALACVGTLLFHAASGHAQSATALDRLDPAPAGDRFTAVPSPEVLGHLRPLASLGLVYTDDPLTLVRQRGSSEDELLDLVSRQLTVHGSFAMELAHRVKVELSLPMIVHQAGDSASLPELTADPPAASAAGDLRTGLRFEVLRQQGHAPSASVGLSAWLPTGDDASYAGAGVFRVAPSLIVGADHGVLAWSTYVAARLQPGSDEPTLLGSELLFGAALGPRIGPVRLAVEVFGSTVLDRSVEPLTLASTSVNGLLTAGWEDGPVHFRLGAGPGLSKGVGTPDFRALGMLAYVPPADSHADRDSRADREASRRAANAHRRGDGEISGVGDQRNGPLAPALAGVSDRDGDGVADADDPCPDRIGDPNGNRPGCPPDRDGDGIVDASDACPDVPGVDSAEPSRHGCPGDADSDGILDPDDACPEEAGAASDDPEKNGCPTAVRLVGDRIVILQRVEFATGKDELSPSSTPVLEQVAKVMNEHPEIARVGVDGHTDSVGSEQANVALSQRRALAVVRWLVERGIDARRLEARGYGPRQPIADNATEAGRQKNRRVEFNILRRSDEGEAGWVDGDLDEGAGAP
ncbi:MAG TPA: OmpA family protein [Polyangiaceae bacterium]|nr:OmpA family protein [Polyangiaceae bacterium]